LVALLLGGCQDGTGPAPTPDVETVEITPGERVFTSIGETAQFDARLVDADGVLVEGVSVSWRSSDPSVVEVDGSGLATALKEGTAVIIAEAGAVVGEAAVAVCSGPVQLALAPGGVHVGDPACPVLLPAGSDGDRYRVGIVHLASAAE